MAFKALITLALAASVQIAAAKELTVERIYSSPSLDGASIRGLKISPDGTRVTFLKGKESDYERLDLWEYHLKSGKTRLLFDSDDLHSGAEVLSDEEKARRERLRLKGSGIVSYTWSKDGKALLFPLAGDIYYYKLGDKNARKIVETPEFETDVKFSPKANYVSYVREQNLYVYDLKTGKESQITSEGGGAIKFAMAEFVAQEEMRRMTGYWWAPDESKIALTKVDESPVALVTRSEIYAEEIKTVTQRYPFAGENNVHIELGVVELASNKFQWIDLGKDKDIYIPRVKWTQDSDLLTYQWQSRDQQTLKLNLYDWSSQKQRTLLTETSDTWINLHYDLQFLKDNKHFIWASERDGFKHLYLYDLKGNKVRQLTQGNWVNFGIEHVNEKQGLVFFSANKASPLETHLYSVPLAGGQIQQISQREGVHGIAFSKDGSSYLDHFSAPRTMPQISLHKANGKHITWINENKVDKEHPIADYLSNWVYPEFGSFKNPDDIELFYRIYKPNGFDASKKYPVIVYLYGGPHVQMVQKRWGGGRDYLVQYLAQQGYVVFTVDNRGSDNRGTAFENPIYKAMGGVEVEDQIAGVKFLHQFPWVDKERVGVHGHSYGGYMTLMAMFKAPEYFKAGVSGAPVTDWGLYDTHYTERYMGNPKTDAEAYKNSSVFPYATNLKGPLLIYHGMADDNVLFKNSTKLYKILQDNNIQFYSMDYPGKKHSIRGKTTQMHRANMIRSFFDLLFGIKR